MILELTSIEFQNAVRRKRLLDFKRNSGLTYDETRELRHLQHVIRMSAEAAETEPVKRGAVIR